MEELFEGSPVHRPLSGPEYARWKRAYRRNPWGEVRGDMQAGIVAQAVYRSVRMRRIPKVEEFVLVSQARKEKPQAGMPLNLLAQAMGVPFTPAPEK